MFLKIERFIRMMLSVCFKFMVGDFEFIVGFFLGLRLFYGVWRKWGLGRVKVC